VVATNPSGTTAGADMTLTTTAAPPSVTAGQPSVVSSSSAVLSGTVNPHGKATQYAFEYGPTTSYGLQSTTASAGSGTSSSAVHASVSGLVAGTVYHYRIVAVSSDGTTASADATFSTTGDQPAPGGQLPVVSETAAVNVGTSSVQLNGAVNPGGPKTTWYFEYGLSSYYGLETAPRVMTGFGARPVNVMLGGLQQGTTYHFRLVAVSANGLYVGPDHTFTTHHASRERARMLHVRTSVAHRSNAVELTISGSLGLPGDVTTSAGCTGAVTVQVTRGGQTVALHRAFLRRNCTYRLRTTIARRMLGHATSVRVVERFEGNQALLPLTRRITVRV